MEIIPWKDTVVVEKEMVKEVLFKLTTQRNFWLLGPAVAGTSWNQDNPLLLGQASKQYAGLRKAGTEWKCACSLSLMPSLMRV